MKITLLYENHKRIHFCYNINNTYTAIILLQYNVKD